MRQRQSPPSSFVIRHETSGERREGGGQRSERHQSCEAVDENGVQRHTPRAKRARQHPCAHRIAADSRRQGLVKERAHCRKTKNRRETDLRIELYKRQTPAPRCEDQLDAKQSQGHAAPNQIEAR